MDCLWENIISACYAMIESADENIKSFFFKKIDLEVFKGISKISLNHSNREICPCKQIKILRGLKDVSVFRSACCFPKGPILRSLKPGPAAQIGL